MKLHKEELLLAIEQYAAELRDSHSPVKSIEMLMLLLIDYYESLGEKNAS